jgi:hypothetical protein
MYQTKRKKKAWTLPPYLEPFRQHILNTGGNELEDLVNDHDTTVFNNAPRAMCCACTKTQIALLIRLHRLGYLNTELTP